MAARPIRYQWNGYAMIPQDRFRNYLTTYYKVGDYYDLVELELRDMSAHNAFFASLQECWNNLRERGDADLFPSPDHLRKWALTFTEFCHMDIHDECRTRKEAERLSRSLVRAVPFSRCKITDNLEVWHYIPNSQAMNAMPNNRTFAASKRAVMQVLAQRLGVTEQQLWEAGKNVA